RRIRNVTSSWSPANPALPKPWTSAIATVRELLQTDPPRTATRLNVQVPGLSPASSFHSRRSRPPDTASSAGHTAPAAKHVNAGPRAAAHASLRTRIPDGIGASPGWSNGPSRHGPTGRGVIQNTEPAASRYTPTGEVTSAGAGTSGSIDFGRKRYS